MGFIDCIVKGKIVDFEIELADMHPTYMAKVENVSDEALAIYVIDDSFKINDISIGMKGTIKGTTEGTPYSFYAEVVSLSDSSIIQLKNIPARTHLRVNAFILFKYTKITTKDFHKKRKKFIQHVGRESEGYLYADPKYLSTDSVKEAAIHPDIISELHSINKKLNYIIKVLEKSGEKDYIENGPLEVDISGAGLKFITSQDLYPGDLLEIEMVLPISSGIIIELIGEVVRCKRHTQDAQEVAVKYIALNEDDRECIIRYVFKRQRELLRAEERISE